MNRIVAQAFEGEDQPMRIDGSPYEQFAWLRENDPVHWHQERSEGPGYWALTRYADIKALEAAQTVARFGAGLRADRSRNHTPDVLGRLAHGEVDGKPMDEEQFTLDFFHLITAAPRPAPKPHR
ncbi:MULTISPECIES: hypothetical protein [Streptomyces]|uniref:hypothetical protein n=1 Tax=Streptomyces TaxID=1883 RepID=UPI0033C9CF97